MKEASVTGLLAAAEGLLVPLRMGDGLDEAALARLESALDDFASAWRGEAMIPKAAASVLAELCPALETSSYLYPDERGNVVRQQAAMLSDRVAQCFVEAAP